MSKMGWNEQNNLAQAGLQVQSNLIQGKTPTQRESLVEMRSVVSSKLQAIDDAIKALDANPGVESVIDAISKAMQY